MNIKQKYGLRPKCKDCNSKKSLGRLETIDKFVGLCKPCIRKRIGVKGGKQKQSKSERLCKRREAIRILERELQAAYLYTEQGNALRNVGKQTESILHARRSSVVADETKNSEGILSNEALKFDFGEIGSEL